MTRRHISPGCHQLAAIEENVVIAFTPVAGEDNQRLIVILNKAHKVCCALFQPQNLILS
jgi:hypothetical protein